MGQCNEYFSAEVRSRFSWLNKFTTALNFFYVFVDIFDMILLIFWRKDFVMSNLPGLSKSNAEISLTKKMPIF